MRPFVVIPTVLDGFITFSCGFPQVLTLYIYIYIYTYIYACVCVCVRAGTTPPSLD